MEIDGGEWEEAERRTFLARGILILLLLTGFWLAMMPLHDSIFVRHQDWLDALYLFFQIVPVYLGFALIAQTGMSLRLRRPASAQDLGIVGFGAWWLVWVLLLGLGLIGCDVIWQVVLARIGLPLTSRATLLTNYAHLPLSRDMMIVLLCAVAPVGEELLFRGFFFQWLVARFPLILALTLSAGMFAGMHLLFALSWDSGVMSYFLVGLACAWLYWESRSILPGLLLHGGLNMLFVLVVLLHT
jgi:membrane protease YdiL (CAAX protease family)